MARMVKREHVKVVKREPGTENPPEDSKQGVADRRLIRSKYNAVKNLINVERDDISRANSKKFNTIINEVENLHLQVDKPREQVADAEALLDITRSLLLSVKSQIIDGVTPSDFVTSLLQGFGRQNGRVSVRSSMFWGDIGFLVADMFKKFPGCSTMMGPMDNELKQRKVYRKRSRPSGTTRPEELDNTRAEEKTATDRNIATMFDILKKQRSIKLENLVLNRKSFAQTVENIFALSFLVKDGRVEMKVDNNSHLISPMNAPAAGEVPYTHFQFRLDFKDWKMMIDTVGEGEELMPHRCQENVTTTYSSRESKLENSQALPQSSPLKTYSRNRGLVASERFAREGSSHMADATAKTLRTLTVMHKPNSQSINLVFKKVRTPTPSEKLSTNPGMDVSEHSVEKEFSGKDGTAEKDLPSLFAKGK